MQMVIEVGIRKVLALNPAQKAVNLVWNLNPDFHITGIKKVDFGLLESLLGKLHPIKMLVLCRTSMDRLLITT